ncbi:unnamed protein product, partial [Prorocentrum cordatum]
MVTDLNTAAGSPISSHGGCGKPTGRTELEGECQYPARDKFQKTKLCTYFIWEAKKQYMTLGVRGRCRKRNRCLFAHSEAEMRPIPDLRFTKMCPRAHSGEACTDASCQYAHDPRELRAPLAMPAAPARSEEALELGGAPVSDLAEDDAALGLGPDPGFRRLLTE